jgi:aspartate kinase
VPDTPGIAYQILGPVADANIDVDVIIQNASIDGTTDFSFTVHRNDYAEGASTCSTTGVMPAIRCRAHRWATPKIGKVSVVGIGMRCTRRRRQRRCSARCPKRASTSR